MIRSFSPGSFISGLIVGMLLAGSWVVTGDQSFMSSLSTAPSPRAPQAVIESGVVSVADQSAGPTVEVESVTVPPPGVWVAIREVNGNELGNVLGALRVKGPRRLVSVPLLRPTEPRVSYAVELYRDDGDERFDLATDSVYVDFTTSVPAIARFVTTD
jgi:hypothetical protein